MSDLKKIKDEFLSKLSGKLDILEINQIKSDLFGKSGLISTQFKKIGTIEESERKKFASDLNIIKDELQELISSKINELESAEINEKLEKEKIDIQSQLDIAEKDILTFFTNFLRKVDKILPVKIYISKYSIVYLDHLISINDGKAQTTINSMISKINNLDISRYTFSNVKNFTKRYELTFLNKDYFNRLSTKLLLIR